MKQRALPGLIMGILGGLCGLAGALSGSAALALAAGLGALGAGTAAVILAARSTRNPGPPATGATITAATATATTAAATTAATTAANAAATTAANAAEERAASATAELSTVTRALEDAHAALAMTSTAEAELNRGPESVFDTETGLLDERVFVVSFERKVAAARRHLRPLCLVLLDASAGLPDHPAERGRVLEHFGSLVRKTLRDADIACRLGPTTFGLILEDTPEAGGVWAAERLQIAMACQTGAPTRLVAAVAAYPNHGLAAQDVLSRAQDALARARRAISDDDGMGPVEVAIIDLT